jgi:exodeoxyribonuclease V alpha subunit
MNERDTVELEGIVERVVFANEDSGFAVLRLQVEGEAFPITAVGILSAVQVGEHLKARGRFVEDKSYGRQLKVESWAPAIPATPIGIERFLASGIVGGVAKGLAKKLVDEFGEKTLEVIEKDPDRLKKIKGLGKKRIQKIVSAWGEQKDLREVMVFLQSHGVLAHQATKIFKSYGSGALQVVRSNPYRLADEIRGIGFRSADRIAIALGIEKDSPRRAEAGLLYTLEEASDEGHVFLPKDALLDRAEKLLEIDRAQLEGPLASIAVAGRVVIDRVKGIDVTYAAPLYGAERSCAVTIARLLSSPMKAAPKDKRVVFGRDIAEYERKRSIQLADEQREAVQKALSEKLLVITGGPGTGKTTIVNAILALLLREGRTVSLAAPTGRAARRLEETTGRSASTIHRLLELNPRTFAFQRGESNPLEVDAVILDEASMIDTPLFQRLLSAIPPHAQLLVVGDVDQLPSVGPGRVLADLIESGRIPVVRLKRIFRQAESSAIVTNAHRVNEGELPLSSRDPKSDFFFIERSSAEEVLDTIKLLVGTRIPKSFGLDPVEDVQVLTPMHRGTIGSSQLNQELQALLCPAPKDAPSVRGLRIGDKVMQIRNDYELDVSNGDIGRVLEIDPDGKALIAGFDDRRVRYDADRLDDLVPAYACTIHKAQGSEFPAVVIPVHTQHAVMLRRNLLYTAITRGKRLVVLVGEARALRMAVAAQRIDARWSGLDERLRQIPA